MSGPQQSVVISPEVMSTLEQTLHLIKWLFLASGIHSLCSSYATLSYLCIRCVSYWHSMHLKWSLLLLELQGDFFTPQFYSSAWISSNGAKQLRWYFEYKIKKMSYGKLYITSTQTVHLVQWPNLKLTLKSLKQEKLFDFKPFQEKWTQLTWSPKNKSSELFATTFYKFLVHQEADLFFVR